MLINKHLYNKPANFGALIMVASFVFLAPLLSAQDQKRVGGVRLLATVEKKTGTRFTVSKSNVEFPEILIGNETQMLPYIEKYSKNKRDHLVKLYNKGKTFLPKAKAILEKYDLPEELRFLIALESAFNPNAISPAGAVGYWQIMDIVAKEYGMKYNAWKRKPSGKTGVKRTVSKDDRKNLVKATHTAARYLQDRRKNLNDNWLLVVASYNCGEGNVRKAIRKSGKTNPGFWEIKKHLPSQTRAYVMNFIALSVIYHNYELFAKDELNFEPGKIIFPDDLEVNVKAAFAEMNRGTL